MRIDPQSSHPALRLVRPPEPPPAASPTRTTPHRPHAPRPSLQSVHVSPPPHPEAQRRTASIQRTLLAGQTDVPIHFGGPAPAAPPNPYALAYQRSAPDPAERNDAATSAAAQRHQE